MVGRRGAPLSASRSGSPSSRVASALPVVTSFMGRGLLACPRRRCSAPTSASPAIRRSRGWSRSSDALFLLGVILSDTNFGVSAPQIDLRRTIHALRSAQVPVGYHIYPDIPLEALVDALLARLPARLRPADRRRASAYPRGLVADDAPITPRRHRPRGQRPDGRARADADRLRRGRLPVHRDGHRRRPLVAPGYYAAWASACRPGSACRPRAAHGR